MSVPFWRRVHAAPIEVDALVVGAGICGVSAAHELLGRGLRVAVVERSHLGAGASSRNAGFLMRGMAENYARAVGAYGRDLARMMWRWTEENLRILLSRGAGTLRSFRPTPSCLLALDHDERDQLRESLSLLREDGFTADWLDTHDDDAWTRSGALGGLVNPGDASVDPWELLTHLAHPLAPVLLEGQELLDLSPAPGESDRVLATTTSAAFCAPRVLICTNAYTPRLLPALATRVAPTRAQMLAIRPDPPPPGQRPYRLDFSYYANHGHEYFRQTPDGVVVLGGKRWARVEEEVGYDDQPTDAIQNELDRFARSALGLRGRVIARWAGIMGFTPDALPLVGPVDLSGTPHRCPQGSVWLCAGFTGHGMSLGARTARAAVTQMLDGAATPLAPDRAMNS